MNIAENINNERARLGWSIHRLAKECEKDYSNVWRNCKGKAEPSMKTLKRYAEVMGVEVWQLLK